MGIVGDRTLYIVPLPIRQNARQGLQQRRQQKRTNNIPNAFEVATALITGKVDKSILIKMLMFFKDEIKNSRKKPPATLTERLMFGGDEGLKFVLEHVKELKK